MLNEVNASLYINAKQSKLNIALNVLIAAITLALVLEIVFCLNYSGIYVVGTSMNNTLIGAETETSGGGDYVYVNKHAKPDYGDIVVVFKDDKTTIIKRVIAKGGDYVKLSQGELWIKYAGSSEFVLKEEDYVSPENNYPSKNNFPVINGILDEEGYLVDEGCLFLLGDNRNVSLDSRENGGHSFPLSELFGVVTKWSMPVNGKSFYTSLHKFFYFDVPEFFGAK